MGKLGPDSEYLLQNKPAKLVENHCPGLPEYRPHCIISLSIVEIGYAVADYSALASPWFRAIRDHYLLHTFFISNSAPARVLELLSFLRVWVLIIAYELLIAIKLLRSRISYTTEKSGSYVCLMQYAVEILKRAYHTLLFPSQHWNPSINCPLNKISIKPSTRFLKSVA